MSIYQNGTATLIKSNSLDDDFYQLFITEPRSLCIPMKVLGVQHVLLPDGEYSRLDDNDKEAILLITTIGDSFVSDVLNATKENMIKHVIICLSRMETKSIHLPIKKVVNELCENYVSVVLLVNKEANYNINEKQFHSIRAM